MSDRSKIEWTDATWNPVVGCSNKSPACKRCYAVPMAHRLGSNPATPHYAGLTERVNGRTVWTGKVAEAPDQVWHKPLHWTEPRRIFVNSMGDLCHPNVPAAWRIRAFAVMALTPHHLHQLLTKWPERLREFVTQPGMKKMVMAVAEWMSEETGLGVWTDEWPLPNVWCGFSAEDQRRFDERWPDMEQVANAGWHVWASLEPLLGPIKLGRAVYRRNPGQPRRLLQHVVAGGESGQGARPPHPNNVRSIRDQCDTDVLFNFKQWGEWAPVPPLDYEDVQDVPFGEFHDGGSFIESRSCREGDKGSQMYRVGKKAAGRLLDGREHNDLLPMPKFERIAA